LRTFEREHFRAQSPQSRKVMFTSFSLVQISSRNTTLDDIEVRTLVLQYTITVSDNLLNEVEPSSLTKYE
jgi:hypothetical protein